MPLAKQQLEALEDGLKLRAQVQEQLQQCIVLHKGMTALMQCADALCGAYEIT